MVELFRKKRDEDDPPFDPKSLDDPLALEIKWTAAHPHSQSFVSHQLLKVNARLLRYKPTKMYLFTRMIFVVVGIGALFATIYGYLTDGLDLKAVAALSVFALAFLGLGFYFLNEALLPINFDRNRQYYWRDKKSPTEAISKSDLKQFARFDDIHAIQLLKKVVRNRNSKGHTSKTTCYELNFVLKDGERLDVVCFGKADVLRKDARTLARFMDIPIWDAIP